jgi:hypothetical protein
MRKIILFFTIISLLLITFSCGGGGGSSQGVSPVTVSTSFKQVTALSIQSTTLTTIRYTVSGSGMETMTGAVPVTGNLVEFTLDVPNGPQRYFLIEALDSSGEVKYSGEADRDLDGTPITITIVLVAVPVPPTFDLSGTWSLYHAYKGESEEGPDCMTISQTGDTFTFTILEYEEMSTFTGNGTIIGTNIDFQFIRCDNLVTAEGTGTTDGNTMSGTFTETGVCPDELSHSPVGTLTAVKGACTPFEAACLTGTWISTDLSYISMTLNQAGSDVTGTWVNSNRGCEYSGSGSYNSSTTLITITFTKTVAMDPFLCCQGFTYNGNVSDCNSMSLNWNNNCTFSGARQY